MSLRMSGIVKGWTHTPAGRKLTRPEKLFLLVLSDYTNDDTGLAWPSVKRLAAQCLSSERAIQYAVRRLCEEGLLEVQYRSHQSNCYRIIVGKNHSESKGAIPSGGATALAPRGELAFAPKPSENRHKPKPPVVPLSGGQNKTDPPEVEDFISWGGGYIGLFAGRKKRILTENERQNMAGARAEQMVELLRSKGFRVRVVPPEEVATWQKASA